jgi:hypothetical protein
MRRFMVHLVTEIDFVDGDEASDEAVRNYQKHVSETVRNAAQGVSLRSIKAVRVENVSVAEIRTELQQADFCGGAKNAAVQRPAKVTDAWRPRRRDGDVSDRIRCRDQAL